MLRWLATGEATQFGRELARSILGELETAGERREAKFSARAERVLTKAARRIDEFRRGHALNFYQKARLSNTFLWTLKDGGCPPDYATQLTEWLAERL